MAQLITTLVSLGIPAALFVVGLVFLLPIWFTEFFTFKVDPDRRFQAATVGVVLIVAAFMSLLLARLIPNSYSETEIGTLSSWGNKTVYRKTLKIDGRVFVEAGHCKYRHVVEGLDLDLDEVLSLKGTIKAVDSTKPDFAAFWNINHADDKNANTDIWVVRDSGREEIGICIVESLTKQIEWALVQLEYTKRSAD